MARRNPKQWTRRAIVTTGALIAATGPAAANTGNNDRIRLHDTTSSTILSSGLHLDATVDVRVQVEYTDEPNDNDTYGNETKVYVKGVINGQGTNWNGEEYRIEATINDEAYTPPSYTLDDDTYLLIYMEIELIPIRGADDDIQTANVVLTLSPADSPEQASIANTLAL